MEDQIREAFSVFGEIVKLDLPRDPVTGLTKGYCFLEYYTEDACKAALNMMDGFKIAGRPIKVRKPLTALNTGAANTTMMNAAAAAVAAGVPTILPSIQPHQQLANSDANRVVYVGSIPYHVPVDSIRQMFEPFGEIVSINMVMNNETGKHRGYGFITYQHDADAKSAISVMNGQKILGRAMVVNYSNNNRTYPTTAPPIFIPPPLPSVLHNSQLPMDMLPTPVVIGSGATAIAAMNPNHIVKDVTQPQGIP
uniref:Poly(U)-binding-splicing factor PUF60 n=1 Tax=Lygus hesperus TaxID=30085 RepID=A0A0A9X5R2_LYGHE